MIEPGSIVRRIGELRQYRLTGYREWKSIAQHETVFLAIMEPLTESMIKRVYERPENLVEVQVDGYIPRL